MGLNCSLLSNEFINKKVKPEAQKYSSRRKNRYTSRNFILTFLKFFCMEKQWSFTLKNFQAQQQQSDEPSIQKITSLSQNKCDARLAYRKRQSCYCETSKSSRDLEEKLSNFRNSLGKQSIRFYAASSIILAYCLFTTPVSAIVGSPTHPV